jgi:hypothetical protein
LILKLLLVVAVLRRSLKSAEKACSW